MIKSPLIPQTIKTKLAKFNPTTISHKGANSPASLAQALQTNIDFVEADIQEVSGRLAVAHERFLGPFAFEKSLKFLRIFPPKFYFDNLVKNAIKIKKKLFLDLYISPKSAKTLVSTIKHNRQKFYFSSKNWQTLDAIAATFGNIKQMYYTVNSQKRLNQFLAEQTHRCARGVSLHKSLAHAHNIASLKAHNLRIWVHTLDDPWQTLAILNFGVDGIISNNLRLLSIFKD